MSTPVEILNIYQELEEINKEHKKKVKLLSDKINPVYKSSIPVIFDWLTLGTNDLLLYNRKLSHLPPLPKNLLKLNCNANKLTVLPDLPPNLKELHCDNNKLKRLPKLPATLTVLSCSDNQLSRLSMFPPLLQELYCQSTHITSLPILPTTLHILYISHNYFLWNTSRCSYASDVWIHERNVEAWSNYKILNKLMRITKKRKRRQCYLIIKDVVTNDLAGVVCKYT